MRSRRATSKVLLLALCAMLYSTIAIEIDPANAASTSEPSQSNVQTPEEQRRLSDQVQAWIDELAKQPAFASWTGADFTIEPLGPGTHAWYVSVRAEGRVIGYMIVNATANGGFTLGEYGVGNRPLFDAETLRQSLIKQGVIAEDAGKSASYRAERLYANGVLAVWRIVTADQEVLYADAATGDILPTTDAQWARAAAAASAAVAKSSLFAGSAGTQSKVYRAHHSSSFDIYADLPWLTSPSIKLKYTAQLMKPLDSNEPIRYVAELYDRTATFVWGIIGYQEWTNNAVYLTLEEPDPEGNGPIMTNRYVGLAAMNSFGRFYR